MDQINQAQTAGALSYYTVPRNGLKRFIFYDRSKQESRSAIDTLAYKNMLSMLQKRVKTQTGHIFARSPIWVRFDYPKAWLVCTIAHADRTRTSIS